MAQNYVHAKQPAFYNLAEITKAWAEFIFDRIWDICALATMLTLNYSIKDQCQEPPFGRFFRNTARSIPDRPYRILQVFLGVSSHTLLQRINM